MSFNGRKLAIITIIIGACIFLTACYHAIGFTWDDPFISYRYAQNLAEGNGLVFNIGERVEGYSNLLFVLICTVAYMIGFGQIDLGLLYFGKIFGLICAFGSVIVCWHFLRRWDFNASIGYAALAVFGPWMLLTNVFYAGWAMGGMETVFFPCLLMIASFLLLQEVQRGKPFNQFISWPAFFFWLAAVTRPEGPVLWFAALIAMLSVRKKYSISNKLLVSYAVTFVILMMAFLLHRYFYFGDILPNTYYAKATGGIRQIVKGLYNFTEVRSFAHFGNVAAILLIFLPLCYPRVRDSFGFRLIFFQVVIYFLFIISSGKDWMGGYRFFIHILPLMATGASMGISALLSREPGFCGEGVERPMCLRIWLLPIAILLVLPPLMLKLILKVYHIEGMKPYIEPKQFALGLSFLLVILAVETWRERHRERSKDSERAKTITVVLVLIILILLNLNSTGWKPNMPGNNSFLSANVFEFDSGFTSWPPPMMIGKYYVIGRWMRENLDNDGLLAIGEAGAIPYLSGQPIIDCFGLMDKTIARMPGTTFFDKSNSREAAEYILSREPKYFLFKGRLKLDGSGIAPSWHEFHYIKHIWEHPDFKKRYKFRYVYEDFIIYERE